MTVISGCYKFMNKLNISHFITAILAVAGAALWFYINMNIRMTIMEKRQDSLETTQTVILNKLDQVASGINDIKLELKDKADRQEPRPVQKK